MRFLLDECCSARLVDHLREAGHEVTYIMEDMPGATDGEVLTQAYHEDRILVTEDKDFGELVFRLKKEVIGIILLRFLEPDYHLQWVRLEELISLKGSALEDKFVVVDKDKFRIRKL